ncbi:MAG: deoxynucleoside kinase [Clostridiales bacterium]|nr:deoxynucleoside kinase [Clostridiales bacterium]
MGKLIVLEGIDGSGKSTQFRLLCEHLEKSGADFRRLSFPQYGKPSAALVEMYLAGDFGKDAGDVSAYTASTFFAVDRAASYLKDWRGYYNKGGLLVTDRYTTSNAIHQGAKLPKEARRDFFKWLYDFEFRLLELPRPDLVIYLDIPAEAAISRIAERREKSGGAPDIHERDAAYLRLSAECGAQAAAFYGWRAVPCFEDGAPRLERAVFGDILAILQESGLF